MRFLSDEESAYVCEDQPRRDKARARVSSAMSVLRFEDLELLANLAEKLERDVMAELDSRRIDRR